MIELLEGKKIDSEYEKDWKEINREIFDKIISLDPITNLEADRIGPNAKQLLLPHYLEGEVEFLDDAENVKTAIDTFMKNRGSYPQALRNIANFPSVKDFVDYILHGDESEFAKNFDLASVETKKEKENPLDIIYNKYYKDLPRETFDKIIEVDPETTNKSVGATARNFLLVKALKGEDVLSYDLNALKDAIIKYNAEKDKYPKDKQSIQNFESVKDFMKYIIEGPETDFIKRLKNNDRGVPQSEFNFIGSTSKYDIVQPLTHRANELIDRNVDDNIENFVWCTGWKNDTSQWRNHSGEWIYCFISKDKPSPTNQTDRKLSYQLSIYKEGRGYPAYTVCQFLDGNDYAYDNHNAGSATSTRFFRDFLNANTDVALLLGKTQYIKENDVVKEVVGNLKYLDKPFIYNGPDSLVEFKTLNVKNYCKELVVRDVESIPAGAFSEMPALRKVTFEEGLKEIGTEAFMKDISLNNIVLPNSLERINTEAFANCIALKNTIRIPDNLVYIGREAFRATGVTLSINKARTKKLQADPADRAWFASHAKGITVQEGLEENMNKEEIIEDIIDENIPKDLAIAYKKSNSTGNSSIHHPSPNHQEINRLGSRRSVQYDYKNSNYEQMSKDEAVAYLGITANVTGNEETGYTVKARVTNRELFNPRIGNLRFLINGELTEFDVQEGTNVLKPIYACYVPDSKFGPYPKFANGSNYTSDISKYSDFYVLVQISDKIYKTDEYEHRITDTTPTGKKVKLLRKDSNGDPVRDEEGNLVYDIVDDTIYNRRNRNNQTNYLYTVKGKDDPSYAIHNLSNNITKKSIPNVADTGSHDPKYSINRYSFTSTSRDEFDRYANAVMAARKAFKEFDYIRKYIKKVEAEKEYYEEDEYNELINNLNNKKDEYYEAYLEAQKYVKTSKQKLITSVDDITLDFNKRFKDQINRLDNLIKGLYENNKQQAEEVLKVVVTDPEETKRLENRINTQKEQIEYQKREVQQLEEKKEELLRKIEQIKQEIINGTSGIDEAIKKLEELIHERDEFAEKAIKQKYDRLAQLKEEEESLRNELNALAPKVAANKAARAAKNKEKELDPSLSSIIVFGEEPTNSETQTA